MESIIEGMDTSRELEGSASGESDLRRWKSSSTFHVHGITWTIALVRLCYPVMQNQPRDGDTTSGCIVLALDTQNATGHLKE